MYKAVFLYNNIIFKYIYMYNIVISFSNTFFVYSIAEYKNNIIYPTF